MIPTSCFSSLFRKKKADNPISSHRLSQCSGSEDQANRDDCVIDCSALAASLNQSLATAPRQTITPRFSIANLGSSHHVPAPCPPPPAQPRALRQPSSPACKDQPSPHASTYPHADIYPVSATIRDLHQQLSGARANHAQAQQSVSVLAWHVCAAEGTAATKRNNLQPLRAEFAAASATGASYPGLQRQLDEVQQEAEAAQQQVSNLKHQLQLAKDEAARYAHTANCLQHHIGEQQQREHQQLQLQQLQQRCRELDVRSSQASLKAASLLEQLTVKEQELQQERSRNLALQQNLQQGGHFPDALRVSRGDTHSPAAQPPPSAPEQVVSPQASSWQLQQQDADAAPAREDRPSSPIKVKSLPGRVYAPAADAVAAPAAAEVLKQQIGSAAAVGPKVAATRNFSKSDDLASTLPTDQAALQPVQQPDSPEADASNSSDASLERSNSVLPRPVAFFISSDSFSLGSTAAKSSRSTADSLSINRSRSQTGRSTGGGTSSSSSSRTSRPRSTSGKSSAVKAPPVVTPLLAALAGRPAAAGAPAALIKTTPQGSSTFSLKFSKAPTAATESRTQTLDSARSLSCPGVPPSTGHSRGSSSALVMLLQKPSAARGSSISAGGRYASTAESPASSCSSSTAQPTIRSTSSTGGSSSAVPNAKLMPSVSQINTSAVAASAAITAVPAVAATAGVVSVSRPHALAMGWGGPSKRRRQPGDLAPHLQTLEATYAEVMQEWTELKKTLRRGKRTPACRAMATNSCDICLRFACPPTCDICYGTCLGKAKA